MHFCTCTFLTIVHERFFLRATPGFPLNFFLTNLCLALTCKNIKKTKTKKTVSVFGTFMQGRPSDRAAGAVSPSLLLTRAAGAAFCPELTKIKFFHSHPNF